MKKTINFISLIGSNKIIVDKELEEHNFTLEAFQNYGEYSYGVYTLNSIVVRTLNIKFRHTDSGEFVDTIIIG